MPGSTRYWRPPSTMMAYMILSRCGCDLCFFEPRSSSDPKPRRTGLPCRRFAWKSTICAQIQPLPDQFLEQEPDRPSGSRAKLMPVRDHLSLSGVNHQLKVPAHNSDCFGRPQPAQTLDIVVLFANQGHSLSIAGRQITLVALSPINDISLYNLCLLRPTSPRIQRVPTVVASRLTTPFIVFSRPSSGLLGAMIFTLIAALKPGVCWPADLQHPRTQRPNILWIMSEDNSKHYLRHFDRHGVVAPNIEELAQHGVTFDRAFLVRRSVQSLARP